MRQPVVCVGRALPCLSVFREDPLQDDIVLD